MHKLHLMANALERAMHDLYTHAPDGRLLSAANPFHTYRPAEPADLLGYAQARTLVSSLRRMADGLPIPSGWAGQFVKTVAETHRPGMNLA